MRPTLVVLAMVLAGSFLAPLGPEGDIACYVGVLFTLPLAQMAIALAYEADIEGRPVG